MTQQAQDPVGRQNLATYVRSDVVEHYSGTSLSRGLLAGEAALVERFADEFATGRLLDLGIGGGRTTAVLSTRVADYVGIDYSSPQVEQARLRFPGLDLRQADARDLADFADSSFDLVLFSFNGIDYVGHADRLRILAEVRRVLRPGGLFLFSTHFRGYRRAHLKPWQGRRPSLRALRETTAWVRAVGTRRRLARHEVDAAEYSIINDDAHGYTLLTYYIGPVAQLRQLALAGFVEARAYDNDGTPDRVSPYAVFLNYTARKAV